MSLWGFIPPQLVLAFSSIVQCSESDRVQSLMKRIKQRDREKRKIQSNYTGSFHNPVVVLSPLHFQGEFSKSISDYKCSSTKARDFQMLKHTSKRFPMLK